MSKAVPIGFDPAKVNLRVAPLEIRIVLNLEHTAGHPDYLANSKELDSLISVFPDVNPSEELKLSLTGAREVKSRCGNYQLKENGDISQFIPYADFINMGGSENFSPRGLNVPIRILTYECVDDWAISQRKMLETLLESDKSSEQVSKSQKVYPNPKVY